MSVNKFWPLIAVLALIGCAGAPAPEMTEVQVQMSWTHEYSASPFYAAELNGHFADQNLEVELVPGGFGPDGYIEPIGEVVSGNADFGLASAATLIQARAAGEPVVAVASLLQRSPFALISLADSGITRPEDLVGKRVAVSAGGAMDVYLSFLDAQGIDPASVDTVERTSFGVDPLLNGEVDVLAGWIINEAVLVEEAGYEAAFILPSDYGIESYDFVVFTTEDMVANHHDVVERFVRAIVAGVNDVVADPEQAVSYTLQYAPDLNHDEQLRRLMAMLPLINPAGGQLGSMRSEIWQGTYDMMIERGVLNGPVDFEAAYTTEFLDTIYSQ